jgi:glycosyltransferase involved in cell wall biosynthesis
MESCEKRIYISANSPGEISGWLKPIVRAIKEFLPGYGISVILLPCVFASGREKAVVETIKGVDEVLPSRMFLSLLFKKPDTMNRELIHLGGDIWFTALLARRWKSLAWSYQWGKKSIDRYYRGYFVKTEPDKECLLGRGIEGNKIHIVGDLLWDAVADALGEALHKNCGAAIESICFMAGSRLKEVLSLLPFYLQIAGLIKAHFPSVRFKALISPYVDLKELERLGTLSPLPELGGLKGTLDIGRRLLQYDETTAIELIMENHIQELSRSDFVITIPGTKTGEAGCLGKPMAVLLPLNKPEDIPYMGIIGLLDWLPIIGPRLKAPLIMKIAAHVGWVSQPNILADREIVPEIKGILTANDVAERIIAILGDSARLAAMNRELEALYSPFKGASTRMVAHFARTVRPDSDPEKPFFSIIICTRNRKELLAGAIKTLDDQSIPAGGYEIIVIDDGSTDGTEEMIGSMKTACTLRYMNRPWKGRAGARNHGIHEARGDIIVFVDDDILAPHDFLFEHHRFHKIYSQAIVRGPIINIEQYEFPRERKARLGDFSQAFFCTCNVSVARQELVDVGGFDETFIEYGYEDNEVGWRLRQKGLKARFNMGAIVYHYKPRKKEADMEGMIRTAQELARSAVAYYRKHPHWKTRLATGIYPFYFARQWLFANRLLKDLCLKSWKERVRNGDKRDLRSLERTIFDYYYGETLKEELRKGKAGAGQQA